MEKATDVCRRVVEDLTPLGEISSKKMFGGYGIFANDTMFALINAGGQLFLKTGESNQAQFEEAGSKRHGRMPYFSVPREVLKDSVRLHEWAKSAIEVARAAKK
ncbi:MAG: TfoX/Sxy family protein [Terriglobia bacterium]